MADDFTHVEFLNTHGGQGAVNTDTHHITVTTIGVQFKAKDGGSVGYFYPMHRVLVIRTTAPHLTVVTP